MRSDAPFCFDYMPGYVSLGISWSRDAARIWLFDFPHGFFLSVCALSKQLAHKPLNTDRNILRRHSFFFLNVFVIITCGLNSFE